MGYLKVTGVVIREVNTGDADKIITILSKTHGKITGFAKGAKRPKSRYGAGSQLLCYSDFVLYKGRDMYTVNSSDVIESFYEIRNDIINLTYTAHMLDLLNDVIQENQPSTKVLQLFLNALYMLAKTDKSPELVTRVFELRLLTILGYAPYVKGCMECSSESENNYSFSFRRCGLLCTKCIMNDQYAVNISIGTAKVLRYIVYSKMKDLFSFSLSNEVLTELEKISKRYIKERLEKNYTKLDFLKVLNLT